MKADRYRYDDHDRPDLRDLPTHAGVDKDCREEIEEKTAENIETMKELQDALYADGREGIVIVLQAMDAAGKDSTIKHVMSGLNPQGVMVHSFKQPAPKNSPMTTSGGWYSICRPGAALPSSTAATTKMCWQCRSWTSGRTIRCPTGSSGTAGGILPQALPSDPAVRGIPL